MAQLEEREENLSVSLRRVCWILVFTVIFLSWTVLGFVDQVDRMITERSQILLETVDHELDDSNDIMEMLMQDKCSAAYQRLQMSCIGE
tara:strand:+ start:12 stop:278 length:267 start_codon:yes stop_codon:yes gene_type:complete